MAILLPIYVIASFVVVIAHGSALADEKVVQGPVFDPRTGSYFELWERTTALRHNGPTWQQADYDISKLHYKGRTARLAVVPDQEALDFIAENFSLPSATWIGLRYFCRFRKLLWTSGDVVPLRSVALMWAPQWHRTDITCTTENIEFMPVALTDRRTGAPRFQATGPAKGFYYVLVEYPKPPEVPQSSKNTQEGKQ
jgi:hypothetical protein